MVCFAFGKVCETVVPVAPHAISFTEVLETCQRVLSFRFMHNESLPQGNASTCSGGHTFVDGLPGSTQERVTETDLNLVLTAHERALLVASPNAPTHLSFDWMACGHPPDEWKKPHYDLHFFTVVKKSRPPPCSVGTSYVCKEKNDPKYFLYGDAEKQVLRDMGPDVSGIVGQGNHWAVRPPPPFTEPEIVFITYNKKVIGYETMFPVLWFSAEATNQRTFEYKNVSALLPGWHPVQITEKVIQPAKEFEINVTYQLFPFGECGNKIQESNSSVGLEEEDAASTLVFSCVALLVTCISATILY